MVIVMLRHEVQMIHQPHGLLQTWMQHRTAKDRGFDAPHPIHQPAPGGPELSQNLVQVPGIVVGLMRLAIAEVRHGEGISTSEKIFDPRHPKRLKIQQMSGVLLRRPLVFRFRNQHIARYAAQKFFQPRGGSL